MDMRAPGVPADAAVSPRARGPSALAVLGAALTPVLVPVLLTAAPPLVDYPNHLGRAVFLARGAGSHLTRAYDIVWENLPNLGTDLFLMGLVNLLPPVLAGRLLIGLVLITLVLGVVLYARQAFGSWTWWSAVGSTAAFNGTFLFGFLSFNLACGQALLLAAAWRWLRPERPAIAAALLAVSTAVIWFTHLGGLLFAAALGLGAELDALWRDPSGPWSRRLLRRVLPLLPALLVLAGLVATSAFTQAGGDSFYSLRSKPFQFYLAFVSYDHLLDILPLTCAGLLLAFAAGRRSLVIDRASLIALLLCLLLFCISPLGAKGGYWISTRFAVMASLLVFAGCLPRLGDRGSSVLAALTIIAVALRLGGIGVVWTAADRETTDLRAALACLEPGALVAVYSWPLDSEGPARPQLMDATPGLDTHIGAWAVAERDAIWLNLFALPGQQPIRLKEEFAPLTQPTYVLQPLGTVVERSADGRLRLNREGRQFDALVLVRAEDASLPAIDGLTPVKPEGSARLLSVEGRGVDPGCR